MATKKQKSVERFRNFIKMHPHLRKEVKSKQTTWQELFEEWYLLGEDHPRWNNEERSETKEESPSSVKEEGQPEKTDVQSTEFLSMVLNALKNMDVAQIQQYITNANQAIGAIQGVLEAFQGSKNDRGNDEPTQQQSQSEQRSNPFVFRKD